MAKYEVQLQDSSGNSIYPLTATRAIESGADLNDCMDVGLWICANSTIAGSLTHSPITNSGFPMMVYPVGAGNARIQVIFSGSALYARRRTSSAWSTWYSYTGTSV